MTKAVTRTCPECGHTHSVAAETVDAAELISRLEAELAEVRQSLALRIQISNGYSAAMMAAETIIEATDALLVERGEAIRRAAELLASAQATVAHGPWPEIEEWLALPVVQAAVKP